jgi:hypothetical protein
MPIDGEFVAVEFIQPILSAEPQKALVILQNAGDHILRKAEIAANALEVQRRRQEGLPVQQSGNKQRKKLEYAKAFVHGRANENFILCRSSWARPRLFKYNTKSFETKPGHKKKKGDGTFALALEYSALRVGM